MVDSARNIGPNLKSICCVYPPKASRTGPYPPKNERPPHIRMLFAASLNFVILQIECTKHMRGYDYEHHTVACFFICNAIVNIISYATDI